ncbi:MAG TPA: hypothetical protein DEB06_08950 [Phycisphaerales bacterium]|nr:hypothetical protein [Phycisphaerales bacterium]
MSLPIPHRRAGLAVVLGLFAAALLAGCHAQRRIDGGRPFPTTLAQAGVSDVQVQRAGTTIRLTNTSARTLGPGVMWINGQFAREIDAIPIGASASFALADFRNEFGERFRAGGFFATEPPDRVVRAQVEQNGSLTGLIVVGGGEE